jgi:C-terminal processing protease CtpA/Prc
MSTFFRLKLHKFALTLIGLASIAAANAAVPDSLLHPKKFSKKQLVEDVEYTTKTIANVHPNMYHSVSPASYARLKDSVIAALKDSMTVVQAWPVIARLIGALNEGHSSLFLTQDVVDELKSGANVLFPVAVREFDGTYFIVGGDVSAAPVLKVQDKIISINGISASAMVDKLSQGTGGLKSWRALGVCRDMAGLIYLYGVKAPYTVKYLRDGKAATATLNAVAWPEFSARRRAIQKDAPVTIKKSYYFSRIDNSTGYLVVNDMHAKPAVFKQFLDSTFIAIQQQPVQKLIIDLRQNGGGNSELGHQLLQFITDMPFRMTGGVKLKISQEFKDAFTKNNSAEAIQGMSGVLNKENGSFISSNPEAPKAPAPNPLLFKGKVYVLIGPNTFSSANMLANTIQDYQLAQLIGSPTGEYPNDYGEVLYFTLPNTKISFGTSSKQFVRANGDTKNNNPVLPDFFVKDSPTTPADEVLEFAKQK